MTNNINAHRYVHLESIPFILYEMHKIVVIEKAGTLKTVTVKDFTEESLYKKAGLKVGEGFVLQHTWGAEDGLDQSIKLYGKKTGRAGQENKYDFPPPVDNVLFFGPCILICSDLETGKTIDLAKSDWEEIYEYLFGGFENVGSEDSDDSDLSDDIATDDEIDALQKSEGIIVKQTKQGYAKDGFIVDDEDEEEDSSDSSSSEEEIVPIKKRVENIGPVSVPNPIPNPVLEDDLQIDDCESELSEEPYL